MTLIRSLITGTCSIVPEFTILLCEVDCVPWNQLRILKDLENKYKKKKNGDITNNADKKDTKE